MAENKAPEATTVAQANGQKTKRDPHAVQTRILGAMRGQAVRVHLFTGETVYGELLAHDTYALGLRVDGQDKPVLIFKHGVVMIDWAPDDAA